MGNINVKKLMTYFIVTVLMVAFIYCIIGNYFLVKDTMNIQDAMELTDSEDFLVSLYGQYNAEEKEMASIYLKWWHHSAEDMFYLFVPGDIPLYWKFTQVDSVLVDEQLVQEADAFSLEEGMHLLRVDLGEEIKEYSFYVMYSSQINSLFLEIGSGSVEEINSDKEIEETGKYALMTRSDLPNMTGGLISSIRGRGNASWIKTEKKSYQIELETEANQADMGSAKKWLLIANAFDATLMHNKMVFEMAEQLGLSFTPEAEFVDVYANGEYLGNYFLCEKIEVGEERVNIADLETITQELNPNCKLKNFPTFIEEYGKIPEIKGYRVANNPEDITGGYILELDIKKRYDLEESGFTTAREQCVVIKNPKNPSYMQTAYIAEKYQEFEDALFTTDGINPYTGKSYSDYIDVESFVRKYLLEEVTKNLDSAFTSQFFYKPQDSVSDLLYAGPVWDYDKSMGYKGAPEPEGLYANRAIEGTDMWGEIYPHENLWHALYQHDDYKEKVIEIYNQELRKIILNETESEIGHRAELLMDSAMMNAVRWELLSDSDLIENKKIAYQSAVQSLEEFLIARIEYLDQIWK